MQPHEFRDLIAGINQESILELLDIGEATLRRWKSGKARIPQAVEPLLRLKLNGDLAALGGADWPRCALSWTRWKSVKSFTAASAKLKALWA